MTGEVILPGSTIGIIGGGQLGRMFALEARRMGYRVLVLDPGEGAPAAQVSDGQIRAPLDDFDAARALARQVDVVTLEWENADVPTVRAMEEIVPVRPGHHVLEVAQHRVREKDAARKLGLDTAEYRPVGSLDELREAIAAVGIPAVLKTARGGYDGKGQSVIRSEEEVEAGFRELAGEEPADLILEELVPFRMEASVVCARTARGELAAFPVGENIHRNGILDYTIVPARLPAGVLKHAREVVETLAEGLDVVGLLAVELFVDERDRLLVNEIAPRPHNSGHYTWEACFVSQFEQQVRAVCGLPLGSPLLLRPAAMANLLGEDIGDGSRLTTLPQAFRDPFVTLHLYGKQGARPGRKMGHLTASGASASEAFERVSAAKRSLVEAAATPS